MVPGLEMPLHTCKWMDKLETTGRAAQFRVVLDKAHMLERVRSSFFSSFFCLLFLFFFVWGRHIYRVNETILSHMFSPKQIDGYA